MPTPSFWKEAFAVHGSVSPKVIPYAAAFGLYAAILCLIHLATPLNIDVAIAPAEVVGAALGVVLILRTTAGYDRWWEGRKAWGGIVNQSRNLATIALEYGPRDVLWRNRTVRQIAAFAHATRISLRRETDYADVIALLEPEQAALVARSQHLPVRVGRLLAQSLREGRSSDGWAGWMFLEAERQRGLLIDHVGICERIRDSPLPRVCAIKVRRYLLLFLALLPFALLNRTDWLTPFYAMLAAYVLLSLDQVGIELQNPFATSQLSHLPLTELCQGIERTLLAMLDETPIETCGGSSAEQLPSSETRAPKRPPILGGLSNQGLGVPGGTLS